MSAGLTGKAAGIITIWTGGEDSYQDFGSKYHFNPYIVLSVDLAPKVGDDYWFPSMENPMNSNSIIAAIYTLYKGFRERVKGEDNNFIIHCAAGANRSVVVAFLFRELLESLGHKFTCTGNMIVNEQSFCGWSHIKQETNLDKEIWIKILNNIAEGKNHLDYIFYESRYPNQFIKEDESKEGINS